MQIQAQSTNQTCLAVCLIYLLQQKGVTVSYKKELEILIKGLKFTKIDFAIGHLVHVSKKYHVNLKLYIDDYNFYKELLTFKYSPSVKIIHKKINRKFIYQLSDHFPIIIYIDDFYLEKIHAPHFIILETLGKEDAVILDPWDGKRKIISTKLLFKSIYSLKNHLKFSLKVIQLSQDTLESKPDQ